MPSFPEQLKRIREKRKLSQNELGDIIGISSQQIYRYEMGENEPTARIIVKLCRQLQVSADELLGLRRFEETFDDLSGTERKLVRFHRTREGLELISIGLGIEQEKRWEQEEERRRNKRSADVSTLANDETADQGSGEPKR